MVSTTKNNAEVTLKMIERICVLSKGGFKNRSKLAKTHIHMFVCFSNVSRSTAVTRDSHTLSAPTGLLFAMNSFCLRPFP